jgi:hypothetical protein
MEAIISSETTAQGLKSIFCDEGTDFRSIIWRQFRPERVTGQLPGALCRLAA